MIQAIRDWFALRSWKKSPLGQALQHHGYTYFFAPDAPFAHFEEEAKVKQCAELHRLAMSILRAENPLLAGREQLAEYVITFANLMAAGLKEEQKEGDYLNTPYISGKLWPHISQLSDHIDELGRLRFSEPDISDEELVGYCSNRAMLLLFYCNGLNTVSIAVEDRANRHTEWYQAFVQAAIIFAEDTLRGKVGLPSLLPGPVDGLVYSTFMNLVLSGEPDPFFSWTQKFPDRYLYGRGPAPQPV